MQKILHIIDSISEYSGKIFAWIIVILTVIIAYETMVRYVFDSPTVWISETSNYLFGTFVVMGGAYALKYKAHVSMDIIYTRFSFRTQAIIDIITSIGFFAFMYALIITGFNRAMAATVFMERSGSVWNPYLFPIKWVLPIGATLLLLQGIAKLIRDIMTVIKGEDLR
ncbi:MAG: TRAP transporter small permease subunit [Dehalobacterium sp.]